MTEEVQAKSHPSRRWVALHEYAVTALDTVFEDAAQQIDVCLAEEGITAESNEDRWNDLHVTALSEVDIILEDFLHKLNGRAFGRRLVQRLLADPEVMKNVAPPARKELKKSHLRLVR